MTNKIDVFHSNFKICNTGENTALSTAINNKDKCSILNLKYYFKSYPGSSSIISNEDEWANIFQKACNEWTKHTGINFSRTKQNESNFEIRLATPEEETDHPNRIADSFFWSDTPRRIIIHKKMKKCGYSRYTIFLHEIGHILGFRHEHIFELENPTNETSIGIKLISLEVDDKSIMSYNYLINNGLNKVKLSLSDLDIKSAKLYYNIK